MVEVHQTVLATLFNRNGMYDTRPVPRVDSNTEARPRDLYQMLFAYYANNGLYDDLRRLFYESGMRSEAMKSLRNPAYRIVEFYCSKIWPGALPDALPIRSDNANIETPIQQLWKWSNWGAKKQVAVRYGSIYGDLFIKVCSRTADTSLGMEPRVWLDLIKPEYVTEFELDDHGAFVVYIKIDIPFIVSTDADGNQTVKWHTEVWSKADLLYRQWVHDKGPDTPVSKLGQPLIMTSMVDIGIDFVPIAHAKFKDIGEDRGIGSFTFSIEKIDEINRKSTRLSQMLYRHNKALWAVLSNATDKEGRPLAAPRFAGDSVTPGSPSAGASRLLVSDQLAMDDGDILRLPGLSSIESLVPSINYEAARSIIQDDITDLEYDQPEMAYYRLVTLAGEMSGRALRYRLAPAIDRVLEARGNLESALISAHQMALTIGKLVGAFPTSIGSFETGDFDHSFDERPVIPTNDVEDALARKTDAEAASAMQAAGISKRRSLIDSFNYGEDEIDEILQEAEEDAAKSVELAQQAFNAGAGDVTVPETGGADAGNPASRQAAQ